jgi:signal transduction histidine kinase
LSHATEEQKRAKEIITFAPLSSAPWGVVIRQPEAEALANATQLNQKLLIFGLISGLIVLPAIWVSTKRITDPINKITKASKKIAQGSLDEPVTMPGSDEISVLSQSFDTMRTKLRDSIAKIKERTNDLEASNIEKAKLYADLLEKERVLAGLLKRSISAQEEERKRIARELHDETSQALTTLAIGLETVAKSAPKDPERLKLALKKNQDLIARILDDIHRLILDLRPSILDDMGLIPALEWYAHNRLETEGIKVHLETSGLENRLPSHIEIVLFRVIQEALSNIAQHAKADRANISLDFQDGHIKLTVEDDGEGFDPDEVLSNTSDKRGWGLLGITERVEALNGKIRIDSKLSSGTLLDIEIPINHKGG